MVIGGARFVLPDVFAAPAPYLRGAWWTSSTMMRDTRAPAEERSRSCASGSVEYFPGPAAAQRHRAGGAVAARCAAGVCRSPSRPRWSATPAAKQPLLVTRSTRERVTLLLRMLPGADRRSSRRRSRCIAARTATARAARYSVLAVRPVNASLLDALGRIVGPRWVRHRRAELATYAMDGLPTHESLPGAVVVPGQPPARCVEMRAAAPRARRALRGPRRRHRAVGRRAGGSRRRADRAHPAEPRYSAWTPVRRRAVVEPGVVNARLTEAVAPHGLHYVPDPSSQTACTVGGNVAENAGGPHCLKYGVTTNHIAQLEVVLPDGSVATARLAARRAVGTRPRRVCSSAAKGCSASRWRSPCGSSRCRRAVRTMLADFGSVRAASEAVSAVIAAGIVPAALEMMDQACVRRWRRPSTPKLPDKDQASASHA